MLQTNNPIPNGCEYWYEYMGGGSVRLYSLTSDCLLQGDDCSLFYEDLASLKAVCGGEDSADYLRGVQNLISEYAHIFTPYA